MSNSDTPPRGVDCDNRDQNWGRVCVPSMPNDPGQWCASCIDRRFPGPADSARLTPEKLIAIRVEYEKTGQVRPGNGRLLLHEVLRVRG